MTHARSLNLSVTEEGTKQGLPALGKKTKKQTKKNWFFFLISWVNYLPCWHHACCWVVGFLDCLFNQDTVLSVVRKFQGVKGFLVRDTKTLFPSSVDWEKGLERDSKRVSLSTLSKYLWAKGSPQRGCSFAPCHTASWGRKTTHRISTHKDQGSVLCTLTLSCVFRVRRHRNIEKEVFFE